MIRGSVKVFLGIVALICCFSNSARATLIGDEVTLTITNFIPFGPVTAVGSESAVEWVYLSNSFANVTIDILDEDTITIVFQQLADPNLSGGALLPNPSLEFSGLDWGGLGTVVGVSSATILGFGSVQSVTVTDPNTILVSNLDLRTGLSGNGNTFSSLTFDVIAEHNTIPEPSTAALLALGLLATAVFAGRRRTN